MTALVVALGGAAGALSRYTVTEAVHRIAGVPWGTFVVNVTGAFVIGFLMVWLQDRAPTDAMRSMIGVGFLGSFTTFSTFSYETVELMRTGEPLRATGYAAGSVLVGIVAVMLGAVLADAVLGSTN